MKTILILPVLSFICMADFVQFGTQDYPVNRPFCGDCNQSLRDQVLVPSDSIGSAITIGSVAFLVESGSVVSLDQFVIHMGITQLDQLTDTFENNWMTGTKTLVYDHVNVTYSSPGSGQWMVIDLDEPFWYNGQDNLLMEFAWPGGSDVIMIWAWVTEGYSTLYAGWDDPQGNLLQECLVMRLEGTLDLGPMTFAAIKASLGR